MNEPGFVHVHCYACGNKEVWLRCNECSKSDHFVMTGEVVTCTCGATYPHAVCLCGEQVPPGGSLEAVAFDKGPLALADLEIAWGRVAALSSGVLVGLVAALYWWLS